MATDRLKDLIVKEFPREQAGEIAGWVNVKKFPESEGTHVLVAYARIGQDGATHKYLTDDAGHVYLGPDDEGFENPVELDFAALRRDFMHVNGYHAPDYPPRNYTREQSTHFSGIFREADKPLTGQGVWAVGARGILAAIKSGVEERGDDYLYPIIYHTLAYISKEENLLADPEMVDATAAEADIATAHSESLAGSIVINNTMNFRMTSIESDIERKDVPEVFVDTRRIQHKEETRRSRLEQSSSLRLWYGRVGSRREWPYMDASEKDERRAFGLELRDMREKGLVDRASNELIREVKELELRLTTSQRIAARMALLNALEEQSA